MVIKFLENTIGQFQVKQLTKKNKRVPQAVNLSQIKTVSFLCEVTKAQEVDEVLGALKLFESNQITVKTVICLVGEKELPNYIPKSWKTVLTTDQNLWGLINQNKRKDLFEVQADLFCNLCFNSTILSAQIMQFVNTKCIAGLGSADEIEMNDLSIELPVDAGVLELSNNIIRYLKMLNN